YGAVYIACGPVYDHGKPKRIGNNKVAVPDAFYKVILINDSKTPQAIGFLFPNKAGHKPLKKYIVTVDSVEKRTGIDFFPALPDEVENRIEAEPAKKLP
ncbi:DNA/RNA non-specific endonuclease, partial [Phocaeicola massiliensis]|nr:DNA/RNA non-specific endonuclease [Bacteroidaceae bacterium UO.H1004]